MKRINGLDALRAIAVLIVVKTHWGPGSFKTLPILDFVVKYIIPSGFFAVDLFFVLSGFLITGILLRSKRASQTPYHFKTLKTFIIRRALRIFPVYCLLLLVLYIFNYSDIRHYILYYATYTSNYLIFNQASWNSLSHLWSLAVEEQFYLIWPLLILFTPDKYLFKLMLVVIVISTVVNTITVHNNGKFADVLTINCFNAFAIGGLYSLAFTGKDNSYKIETIFRWLLPVAIVIYVLQYFDITIVPLRLVNAIIAVNLIIYVAGQKYNKLASVIINNKLLNSLGKISYGIYLFHYIIPYCYQLLLVHLGLVNKPGFHWLFVPLIAENIEFGLLIGLSYLSFYCFERQVLKLKMFYNY